MSRRLSRLSQTVRSCVNAKYLFHHWCLLWKLWNYICWLSQRKKERMLESIALLVLSRSQEHQQYGLLCSIFDESFLRIGLSEYVSILQNLIFILLRIHAIKSSHLQLCIHTYIHTIFEPCKRFRLYLLLLAVIVLTAFTNFWGSTSQWFRAASCKLVQFVMSTL